MSVTAVESTTLAAFAYDDARGILQLEFRSGLIYHYFDVPASVHEALLCAPSKGKYFNRAVRDRFRYALAGKAQAGKT